MLTQKTPITRIVCSGGGAKGVLYPATYQALIDAELVEDIEHIAGVSVGSIAACLMAIGAKPAYFQKTLLNTDLTTLIGSLIKKSSSGCCFFTLDGKPLLQFIKKLITDCLTAQLEANVEQLRLMCNDTQLVQLETLLQKLSTPPINICFSDIALLNQLLPRQFKKLSVTAIKHPTGEHFVFDAKQTPNVEIAQAIRASCSLPVILEPVVISINDKPIRFMDGGIYDNSPSDFFDEDENGEFIENTQKLNTLIFAFGEGVDDAKNPLHQGLYGRRHDELDNDETAPLLRQKPRLYHADIFERFEKNHLPKWFTQHEFPYQNTEQKEANFHKIRDGYPLRTIQLRAGGINTIDFKPANKLARVMSTIGYLDTMNYLINHDLPSTNFDVDKFYTSTLNTFTPVLLALISGTNQKPNSNPLLKQLEARLTLKKQSLGIRHREQLYLIKDYVEKNPTSIEAIALSRATDLQHGYLSFENLFKEIYTESFKNSQIFSRSQITGTTLYSTEGVQKALQSQNMFHLYHQKQNNSPQNKTRTQLIYDQLCKLSGFKEAAITSTTLSQNGTYNESNNGCESSIGKQGPSLTSSSQSLFSESIIKSTPRIENDPLATLSLL